MRSDYLPSDLTVLWKELAANPRAISADELKREARKLGGVVGLRNWFVTMVGSLAAAAYAFFLMRSKTALERAGAAMSIAGVAFVIYRFLSRPMRRLPQSAAVECTRFYRAELERQRDFHRRVLAWLLPMLPGPILFNVAFAIDRPMFAALVELQLVGMLMIAAIVVPLNLRMARKIQRRIDALDVWA